MILVIDKPAGWTPLEAMEALRARTPELAGAPMVYAGRLDPMAEGAVLVLTGEDRFDLPTHLRHDKEYQATFLFGVRSDTFDALGRLGPARAPAPLAMCCAAVEALVGVHRLPLPAWSAYKVRGRPLHAWASAGRLHEVELPVREMTVRAVTGVYVAEVQAAEVVDEVYARIARVRGAFRQAEATADWARLAGGHTPLVRVSATITVSSGTFIRAFADAVGEGLACGGLLYALRRTRVGPYTLDGPRGDAAVPT